MLKYLPPPIPPTHPIRQWLAPKRQKAFFQGMLRLTGKKREKKPIYYPSAFSVLIWWAWSMAPFIALAIVMAVATAVLFIRLGCSVFWLLDCCSVLWDEDKEEKDNVNYKKTRRIHTTTTLCILIIRAATWDCILYQINCNVICRFCSEISS